MNADRVTTSFFLVVAGAYDVQSVILWFSGLKRVPNPMRSVGGVLISLT